MKRAFFLPFIVFTLESAIPMRIGLGTGSMEYILAAEDGGTFCTRQGAPLFRTGPGEKFRIWQDTKESVGTASEYRVQVGPAMDLKEAKKIQQRLRSFKEEVELVHVADGDSWRVLFGHYARANDAEKSLTKLRSRGFEELWVSSEKVALEIKKASRSLYAITERYERIPLPTEGVLFRSIGECATWVGQGRYRGEMEVFPNRQGRLTLVNVVELETYLRGVVPKELGVWQFPALEGLKAQAVAARTYAYANRGKRAKEGFDLLDTPLDQVYGGRDGEQPLSDRAIAETNGLVATFEGKPIQALFQANSGGETIDNSFVFGGHAPYLKAASNYAAQPTFLSFRGIAVPKGELPSLSLEMLRMAASGMIPLEWLTQEKLDQPLKISDFRLPLHALTDHLKLPAPLSGGSDGVGTFLWMARSLGFEQAIFGQVRAQDCDYFLQGLPLATEDKVLATFLVRTGMVSPMLLGSRHLTLFHGLQLMGRLWNELDELVLQEGTLLKDGQVRVAKGGPEPLKLDSRVMLAELLPGGSLRLATEISAQIGDRLKWMSDGNGARLLVRRMDPDGASLNRYNPLAHWKKEIREKELLERMKKRSGIDAIDSLELKQNAGGRVVELSVKDAKGKAYRYTGMHIRDLLGLRDNVFGLIPLGKAPERRWIAYGRGWGHGVGMDQTGAYGFALEGWTFDQILKHYYKGIELTPVQ